MSTTLTDAWASYAPDAVTAARYDSDEVAARRHFMAGALAVLLAERAGATREQLMAEIVGFGRAVGSQAERASA